MSDTYQGRLALVTGAGSGIGRELALQLAAAGARVVVVERERSSLNAVEKELAARGGQAGGFALDVSDANGVERVAAEVESKLGTVDFLFNNAGIGLVGDFLATGYEQWQRILAVNVMGVVHCARAFGRAMVARGGGHIVNISSGAAYAPPPYLAAYAASKGAVLALSQALRAELAPSGVVVTAVCPGIINTNITSSAVRVGRAAPASVGAHGVEMYRKRGYGPDRAARAILKGIRRGPAILPVAPEAWLAWYLSRAFPSFALPRTRFAEQALGVPKVAP